MKTNAIKEGTAEGAEQGRKTHHLIKLGVDVHWHEYVVVRQIDGSSPQSAQRFSPEGFVAWAARQTQQAEQGSVAVGMGVVRRAERAQT